MAVLQVPRDYPTITAAVAVAAPGDTVKVSFAYSGNEAVQVTVDQLAFDVPSQVSGLVLTAAPGVRVIDLTGNSDVRVNGNELDNVFSVRTGTLSLFGAGGDDTFEVSGGSGPVIGGAGVDRVSSYVESLGDHTFSQIEILDDSSVDATLAQLASFKILTDSSDPDSVLTYGLSGASGRFDFGAKVAAGHAVDVDGRNIGGGGVIFTGTGLDDHIRGSGSADRLTGGAGNDTLFGATGSDTLIGGAGPDSLDGGESGDSYYVDPTDIIRDTGASGIDKVYSNGSYVLAANSGIEQLTTAAGVVSGNLTGDEGGNTITGNVGANILSGQAGADILKGGDGADTLVGGLGRDALNGGGGSDTFRFKAGDSPATASPVAYDTVQDFTTGTDEIDLDIFGAQGVAATAYAEIALNSNSFTALKSAAEAALTGSVRVVFVAGSSNGWLFWDTDKIAGTAEEAVSLTGQTALTSFERADLL